MVVNSDNNQMCINIYFLLKKNIKIIKIKEVNTNMNKIMLNKDSENAMILHTHTRRCIK